MKGKFLGFALTVLALGVPSVAVADPIVVYTSFGPGNSFEDAGSFFGFSIGEEDAPDTTFSRAFTFVPSASVSLSELAMP